MADVTHGETERYRVTYPTGVQERSLSLFAARGLLLRGLSLALFVDGWTEPWPCRLDSLGEVRARCPGAKADPLVVGVAP